MSHTKKVESIRVFLFALGRRDLAIQLHQLAVFLGNQRALFVKLSLKLLDTAFQLIQLSSFDLQSERVSERESVLRIEEEKKEVCVV